MNDGLLVSPADWGKIQRMSRDWDNQPLQNRPLPKVPEPQSAFQFPVVVALLEDAYAGFPVWAELLRAESATETQLVSLVGYAAPGALQSQFKLGFTAPGDNQTTEWTATLQGDATADTVQAALEALPSIDPGDVIVMLGQMSYFGGTQQTFRWIVRFQGKFLGQTIPLLQTEEIGDDIYSDSMVVEEVQVETTGQAIQVRTVIPVGVPTPLRRGCICACLWMPGWGWVIVAAECRDLTPQPMSG